MSAAAMVHSHGSWLSPAHHVRRESGYRQSVSWQDVARTARRRAAALDTDLPTTVLVSTVLDRFNEAFSQGSRPVDLDGWVRRTLREIVALHKDDTVRRTSGNAPVAKLVTQLAQPVRSPALARRRRNLLRRVAEVIGGMEGQVVIALAGTDSADQFAAQLHRSGADVVRLQDEGLSRLREYLDHHPEFRRQLTEAGRDRSQARTAPLTDLD